MKKKYYPCKLHIRKKSITSIGTWSFECEVLRSQQVVLKYHVTLILPDACTPLHGLATKSPGTRWRSPSLTKTEISVHFYMQIFKGRKTSLEASTWRKCRSGVLLAGHSLQRVRLNSHQALVINWTPGWTWTHSTPPSSQFLQVTSGAALGEPWPAEQGKFLCCCTCCCCSHTWSIVSRCGLPHPWGIGESWRGSRRGWIIKWSGPGGTKEAKEGNKKLRGELIAAYNYF